MTKMIILLGGNGYVGSAYRKLLERSGINFCSVSRKDVDYTQYQLLKDFLGDLKPEFLINAAGYTGKPNVDACEYDKANCLFGNAVLPGIIAEACQDMNLPWGHVSSGCIYTGAPAKGGGYTEEDDPNFTFRQNNCSFYSGTKALGEEVLEKYENVYVWRLRIPFNEENNPRNYLTKLMRYNKLLKATNSISQLDEFAACSFACWEKRAPFGKYNVTNPGAVTTEEVVELIKKSGLKTSFEFFEDEAEFMKEAATAPRSNCILESSKLNSYGIQMTPVLDALENSLQNWSQ